MAWLDRLSTWADQLLERYPGIDQWMERHFHAFGMHGPVVRHLIKTRVFPATVLLLTTLLVLLALAVVRRARLSAAGGRPQSP